MAQPFSSACVREFWTVEEKQCKGELYEGEEEFRRMRAGELACCW